MKCISSELIQKYIDGESTSVEEISIETHIATCKLCYQKVESQRKLAFNMKQAIQLLTGDKIIVPTFAMGYRPKRNVFHQKMRYIYAFAAACIIFMVLFVAHHQTQVSNQEVLIFNNTNNEFDANLPATQQAMTITAVDPNGNDAEYYFD